MLSFSLTVRHQGHPAPAASHTGLEGRGDSLLPPPRPVSLDGPLANNVCPVLGEAQVPRV